MKPNERLREARLATGRTEAEVADFMGIGRPSYYDLETDDGDMYMSISMATLHRLAESLGVTIRVLFDLEGSPAISFTDLGNAIRQRLIESRTNVLQFENVVGWKIGSMLDNPGFLWDQNIDCLRDICGELGLEWTDALPA